MSQRVLIRLLADGSSQWLPLDSAGRATGSPQSGMPVAGAEEVSLLLPSEDVLLLTSPRLAGRAAQVAKALPYAIEERLAAPVEAQHVAFETLAGQDGLAVAVVAKSVLESALQQVTEAGLQADHACSLVQCLPWRDGAMSVLVEDESVLLRWSRSGILSGTRDQFAELLSLLQTAGVDVSTLRVWRTGAALDVPAGSRVEEDTELPSVLPWLAGEMATGRVELLQGDYQPRRRRARREGRWRLAAMLAAAAVLVGFLQLGIERWRLAQHVETRRAEMEALLRETLPEVQRVVDPVAQLGAELDRRGGGRTTGGALPLIGKVAPLVAGSGRYTIEGLDYRAGVLEMTVRAPDVAALDGLRDTLSALPSLQVELTSALPGSQGYEGRLRIREGAG